MNKTAKVVSTLEGRLTKLNFDLNDRVKAGDVLALVQTPELLGKAARSESADRRRDHRSQEHRRRTGRQGDANLHDQRTRGSVGHRRNQGARHRRGEDRSGRECSPCSRIRTKHSTARSCASATRWKTESRTLEVRIEVEQRRRALEAGHVRRRGDRHDRASRTCCSFPTPRCKPTATRSNRFRRARRRQI